MAFKTSSGQRVLLPEEKKQRVMFGIFGLLVAVILVTLYFGFWRETSSQSGAEQEAMGAGLSQESSFEQIKEMINFDTSFLKDPTFKELEIYGEWPIQIEKGGNENPFSG